MREPVNPIKCPPTADEALREVVRQLNAELSRIRSEVPIRVGEVKTDSGLALVTTSYVELRQGDVITKLGVVS